MPVAYAVPPQQAFSVTCPPNLSAGQAMNIQVPGHQQPFEVTIPDGIEPGQQFQVSVPMTAAVPVAVAQSIHNPIQQQGPQVIVAENVYGQTVTIVVEDIPDLTEQEQRLMPVYQLGRRVKSAGATDSFFVLLASLFYTPFFLALFPFAICGYWAGKKFNKVFAYIYMFYYLLFISAVGFVIHYIYEHNNEKGEDVQIWVIILAVFMVLIALCFMRVNMLFINELHRLTPQDQACLANPTAAVRTNARYRSYSGF